MIECQQRYPKFPGEPWTDLPGNSWQMISLSDIKEFRFRFHGKVVESKRYLNACLEKEIIHAKLLGLHLLPRMSNNEYKK